MDVKALDERPLLEAKTTTAINGLVAVGDACLVPRVPTPAVYIREHLPPAIPIGKTASGAASNPPGYIVPCHALTFEAVDAT
eukprot:CAMPEP_0172759852 /NCGR_PEP_ID=MMETSP1074-20121228/168527_1 /TAXON_ID=2916 /ORGANISM="Ceratium fusus, Strain PA161109" /LENGTH=81 /DNA_ID=CAMNT_0013593745 /DNA_START=335 /DNA_END=577 /DNA_ORIENTATION=+